MNKIWIRKDINIRVQIFFSVLSLFVVLVIWVFVTTIRGPVKKISEQDYNIIFQHIVDKSDRVVFINSYLKKNNNYYLKKISKNSKLKLYNALVSVGFLSIAPPKKISEYTIKRGLDVYSKVIQNKEIFLNDKNKLFSLYKKSAKLYVRKHHLSKTEKIVVFSVLKNAGISPKSKLKNPIIAINVLAHPADIFMAFPNLIKGSKLKFIWKKSLFFSVWVSLKRELTAFSIVLLFALPIGIFMSTSSVTRYLFLPFLIIGTFIPIAALIPLTMAFFGIGETQKIIFLALGMFFVLLGLIVKEMDEVDNIYLQTGYTLGFSQIKTIFFINFPIALPRIWKHFSAIFGLGWGYIIFAEMINSGSSDVANGIGWLFIARRRRLQIPDMYAIFFVIIFLAFLFSYIFKLGSWLIFKSERNANKGEE